MAADPSHPILKSLFQQYELLGLVGLGKVPDPGTGKAERNLIRTQIAIETLEMLETKTSGNLTPDEQQDLRRILTLLRINYVEEAQREAQPAPQEGAGEAEQPETAQEDEGEA